MALTNRLTGAIASISAAFAAGVAQAQAIGDLEIVGAPIPAGIGFQPAVTDNARNLQALDGMLLIIITAITIFVTALIVWCIVRYNSKSNKTPARFTHNSPIEVTWTVVPIIILVFIGAFSLPVLFHEQEIPKGDITIKATGYQWYWGYEYVDEDLSFEAFKLERDQLAEYGYRDEDYLLATDMAMVVPVGKTIVLQVTAADVIHSWTIPAFGVKQDGVPGRLAELWFNADREGVYFGQCSELCGKDHAYMPITVKVVSEEVYAAWLEETKAKLAGLPSTIKVASN